jgi:hypothetical protein
MAYGCGFDQCLVVNQKGQDMTAWYIEVIQNKHLMEEAFFLMWRFADLNQHESAMYWHFEYLMLQDEYLQAHGSMNWIDRSRFSECYSIANGHRQEFTI